MKTIFYSALALVIIGILYFGFTWYTDKQRSEKNQELYDVNIQASNLNMEGAADMYASMAAAETDPVRKARLLTLEGFSRNNMGEYEAGIPLLKSVVANESLPNRIKAEALLAMMYVSFTNDINPLQLIFNDSGIYAEALSGGDINNQMDLNVAVRNLYKKADTYYPYAFSQLALSVAPAYYLLNEKEASEEDRAKARTAIQSYLVKADSLLNSEMREQNIYAGEFDNVIRFLFPMSMHLRLRALEALALEDESRRAETEDYYAYIIGVFSFFNTPAHKSIESYVRFYYASYLARVYGEIREPEIMQAMMPVHDTSDLAKSNSFSVWKFFEKELTSSTSVEAVHINAVAEYDPTFKTFLISKGWLQP